MFPTHQDNPILSFLKLKKLQIYQIIYIQIFLAGNQSTEKLLYPWSKLRAQATEVTNLWSAFSNPKRTVSLLLERVDIEDDTAMTTVLKNSLQKPHPQYMHIITLSHQDCIFHSAAIRLWCSFIVNSSTIYHWIVCWFLNQQTPGEVVRLNTLPLDFLDKFFHWLHPLVILHCLQKHKIFGYKVLSFFLYKYLNAISIQPPKILFLP